jgi:hypothetical protein
VSRATPLHQTAFVRCVLLSYRRPALGVVDVPWPPCPAGCVPCPFPAPEPPLPPPFVLVLLGVAVVLPPAAPVSELEPVEPFAVPAPVAPCCAGLLSLPLSLHPSKHISPSRTVAPIIALRMLRSFTRLIDFGTVHCDRLAKMSARFGADSKECHKFPVEE